MLLMQVGVTMQMRCRVCLMSLYHAGDWSTLTEYTALVGGVVMCQHGASSHHVRLNLHPTTNTPSLSPCHVSFKRSWTLLPDYVCFIFGAAGLDLRM